MQQTSTDYTWLGRNGDPLWIVQEIKILPIYQMAFWRMKIKKISGDFEIQTDHLISAWNVELVITKKKKKKKKTGM